MENLEIMYNKNNQKIIDECFKTITGLSFNEYKKTNYLEYKDLYKQNQILEEELKELRENYWNIHQILIKNRN